MLPFRTWEASSTGNHSSHLRKVTDAVFDSRLVALEKSQPGSVLTLAPGQTWTVPLRWNNPHASELEVNVWIVNNQYVVPIKKPTCAGEGYQDAAFKFTIPSDFNSLGSKVPEFKGCNNLGDCVLQIYAHSVEPRQYAIGVPLVVTGFTPQQANPGATIQEAGADPGISISGLRQLCLSSADPSADITSAVPRKARLISDVFNHAYQNSDYSPYSGQQPESISQNLQAAAILKMTSGNRGELGKALLARNNTVAQFRQRLDNAVTNQIKNYETVANRIINTIGGQMQTKAKNGVPGAQTCFRCQEVGSANSNRLQTNTYIPSFQITQQALITQAKELVPAQYKCLVSDTGLVQIYPCILKDFTAPKGLFLQAEAYGLRYQGPAMKTTLATMADSTNFKKVNPQTQQQDSGIYAAQLAQDKKAKAPAFTADMYLAGQTAVATTELQDVMQDAVKDDDDLSLDLDGTQAFGDSTQPSQISSSPKMAVTSSAQLCSVVLLMLSAAISN